MTKEKLMKKLKAKAVKEGKSFFYGIQRKRVETLLWQLFHEHRIGFSYSGYEGGSDLKKRRITVR